MFRDPIVEEIRQIREEFAKEFNYDLRAMVEYLRAKEREHPENVVSLPPRPPRKKTGEAPR